MLDSNTNHPPPPPPLFDLDLDAFTPSPLTLFLSPTYPDQEQYRTAVQSLQKRLVKQKKDGLGMKVKVESEHEEEEEEFSKVVVKEEMKDRVELLLVERFC